MSLALLFPSLLAQLPPGAPDGQSSNLILIGLVVGALVLLIAVVALLRARKKPLPPTAPPPSLPEEAPLPKVELPPSELEAVRRREAEEAHEKATELRRQRYELDQAAKEAADAAARDQLAAEAKALKEQEEEAKRAEYRAKKAVELEEKERKKREQAEAERLAAEAAERARAQEEARAQAAAEEARKKIEAQAGQTLAQGLAKTKSQGFMGRLNALFGEPKALDESVLGELEEILFTADIGVKTASSLVELARAKARSKELSSVEGFKALMRREVERIVSLPSPKSLSGGGPPHVVMVVGVNGSGKTTTIGKLAAKRTGQGAKVVLAAGDTFRAAATEQLDVWAGRANAEIVKGAEAADPASVVFEAVKRAKDSGADLVIADTAGRLHTQSNLMEELKKIKRVIAKAQPDAPHEVLLVLDATNGQNAIAQARQFHDAVGVTAIALTKLDGTAKGGVIIGICDELKLPVAWVGVGEKVADLRPFEPSEFVSALFD